MRRPSETDYVRAFTRYRESLRETERLRVDALSGLLAAEERGETRARMRESLGVNRQRVDQLLASARLVAERRDPNV